MAHKLEENGHFNNGDTAYVIWDGDKVVAGPLRKKEADAMLKELKPKKETKAVKKSTTKKVKK